MGLCKKVAYAKAYGRRANRTMTVISIVIFSVMLLSAVMHQQRRGRGPDERGDRAAERDEKGKSTP